MDSFLYTLAVSINLYPKWRAWVTILYASSFLALKVPTKRVNMSYTSNWWLHTTKHWDFNAITQSKGGIQIQHQGRRGVSMLAQACWATIFVFTSNVRIKTNRHEKWLNPTVAPLVAMVASPWLFLEKNCSFRHYTLTSELWKNEIPKPRTERSLRIVGLLSAVGFWIIL